MRKKSSPFPVEDSETQPENGMSAAIDALNVRSEEWVLFTQVAPSSDSNFEVRISVGYGAAGHVSRLRLPVLRGFHTSASAAAFLMGWVEDFHEINHGEGGSKNT